MSVFVPRGVGNGYQTLLDDTAYTYLVNDHWRPDASYVAVDLADPALGDRVADPARGTSGLREGPLRSGPRRRRARSPYAGRWCWVPTVRSGGPSKRSSRAPSGRTCPSSTSPTTPSSSSGPGPTTTSSSTPRPTPPSTSPRPPTGRRTAWTLNAGIPAALARLAVRHGFTLVHYSTDYVFDGTRDDARRGRAAVTAGGLRPGEGRRRPGPPSRAPALPPAHLLGGR